MNKQIRLYNLLFPIWLLWLFPPVLVWVLPANLLVDGLVLFLTLGALGRRDGRRALMKPLWWRFWVRGFAADLAGAAWLLAGEYLFERLRLGLREGWYANLYDPLCHPASAAWALAGVALAGAGIYFLDSRCLERRSPLPERERRRVALTMALVTAPWVFLVPVSLFV